MLEVRRPDKFKPDQLLILRLEKADCDLPSNGGSVANLLRGSRQPPFKMISEEENLAMGENEAWVSLRACVFPPPSQRDRGEEGPKEKKDVFA